MQLQDLVMNIQDLEKDCLKILLLECGRGQVASRMCWAFSYQPVDCIRAKSWSTCHFRDISILGRRLGGIGTTHGNF